MIQIDPTNDTQSFYNALMRRDFSTEHLSAYQRNYQFMLEHNTFLRDTCKE